MSAHVYFALKYILGYPNVSNYHGGFNEWSQWDRLPVETAPTDAPPPSPNSSS